MQKAVGVLCPVPFLVPRTNWTQRLQVGVVFKVLRALIKEERVSGEVSSDSDRSWKANNCYPALYSVPHCRMGQHRQVASHIPTLEGNTRSGRYFIKNVLLSLETPCKVYMGLHNMERLETSTQTALFPSKRQTHSTL